MTPFKTDAQRRRQFERAYAAIARNLREFGYPDVTAAMIADVHQAVEDGQPLPHGIIGLFAKDQLRENPEIFGELP